MSSLSQLIRERDMKRETLSNLFEEKKRIMDQMKTMNEDLLQLDDDIEALEEAHERKQANQRQQQVQPNSNLSAAHRRQISPPSQVKSEP
ncbi:MAG: sensor histidine kinase YesM, partial [Bacillariaceae sp.]